MGILTLVDMQFLFGMTLTVGVFTYFYYSAARKQARAMGKLDLCLKNLEQLNQQFNSMLNEQRRTNRILAELAGDEMGYSAMDNSPSEHHHKHQGASKHSDKNFDKNFDKNSEKNFEDNDVQSQNKLYVGNIDYSATESELESHFASFGQIEFVNIPVNRYNGRARGFGFVTFIEKQDAERAMALNGSEFKGRQIQVNFAKERDSAQ